MRANESLTTCTRGRWRPSACGRPSACLVSATFIHAIFPLPLLRCSLSHSPVSATWTGGIPPERNWPRFRRTRTRASPETSSSGSERTLRGTRPSSSVRSCLCGEMSARAPRFSFSPRLAHLNRSASSCVAALTGLAGLERALFDIYEHAASAVPAASRGPTIAMLKARRAWSRTHLRVRLRLATPYNIPTTGVKRRRAR